MMQTPLKIKKTVLSTGLGDWEIIYSAISPWSSDEPLLGPPQSMDHLRGQQKMTSEHSLEMEKDDIDVNKYMHVSKALLYFWLKSSSYTNRSD